MDRRRRSRVFEEETNDDRDDNGTKLLNEPASKNVTRGNTKDQLSKKRKAPSVEVEKMDQQEEPPALEREDTLILADVGDGDSSNEELVPRQNFDLAREQAMHVCDAFPNANFDQCYRRLVACRNIDVEMQIIVDELNNEVEPQDGGSGDGQGSKTNNPLLEVPAKKQKISATIKASDSLNGDILWIQVQSLRDRFPDLDPNVWYARLEQAADIIGETNKIISELESGQVVGGGGDAANIGANEDDVEILDDGVLAVLGTLLEEDEGVEIKHSANEVYNVMKHIKTMFPSTCVEMIFRRLMRSDDLDAEAQRIVDEISLPDKFDDDPSIDKEADGDRPGPSNTTKREPSTGFANFLSNEQRLAVEQILQMFPDCDPYFVVKEIAEKGIKVDYLIDRMTSNTYPKLKDRLAKERQERRRQEFLDAAKFQVAEFLKVFPNPEQYFGSTERTVGELYRHHAFTQLQNDFPNIDGTFLRNRLEEKNNHYWPALQAVREDVANAPVVGYGRRKTGKKAVRTAVPYLEHPRQDRVPFPDEVDELFYRELQYVNYQKNIEDYLKNKAEARERRIVQARDDKQLVECSICCADDVLPEELVSCNNAETAPHHFCQTCVQSHAEEVIGQGRHQVTCLSDGCGQDVSLATLRRILQPRLIDLILRRSQQEEIRRAGVDNMETCPFCDFVIILDVAADDDRVFRCQNPDCLKQSCRLCKEPNHVPLKCNEVEKADETAMRTFVENRMAEALIRTCGKCNRRIIKEDGCNKMFCPCGVYWCYVCRKQLDKTNPYAHFKENGASSKKDAGCQLYTQMHEVHEEVAKVAGEKAREEYLAKHPELRDDGKKAVDVGKLVDEPNPNDRRSGVRFMQMQRMNLGPMHVYFRDFGPIRGQEDDAEGRREQLVRRMVEAKRRVRELEDRAARETEDVDSANEFDEGDERLRDDVRQRHVAERTAALREYRRLLDEESRLARRRRNRPDEVPVEIERTIERQRLDWVRRSRWAQLDVQRPMVREAAHPFYAFCGRRREPEEIDFDAPDPVSIKNRNEDNNQGAGRSNNDGDTGQRAIPNWKFGVEGDRPTEAPMPNRDIDERATIPKSTLPRYFDAAPRRPVVIHQLRPTVNVPNDDGNKNTNDANIVAPKLLSAAEELEKKKLKTEIALLSGAFRNVNNELIKHQRISLREQGGAIGVEIREAMRARDAIHNRLVETQARALRMGISEEEMTTGDGGDRAEDTSLSKEDIEESIREVMASAKERNVERKADKEIERSAVVERALVSIQYYMHVLIQQTTPIGGEQLREIMTNVEETVLKPLGELDASNDMLAYGENSFKELERALANRKATGTIVPLCEYVMEVRNTLQAVEGEMQRILDKIRRGNDRDGAASASVWGSALAPATERLYDLASVLNKTKDEETKGRRQPVSWRWRRLEPDADEDRGPRLVRRASPPIRCVDWESVETGGKEKEKESKEKKIDETRSKANSMRIDALRAEIDNVQVEAGRFEIESRQLEEKQRQLDEAKRRLDERKRQSAERERVLRFELATVLDDERQKGAKSVDETKEKKNFPRLEYNSTFWSKTATLFKTKPESRQAKNVRQRDLLKTRIERLTDRVLEEQNKFQKAIAAKKIVPGTAPHRAMTTFQEKLVRLRHRLSWEQLGDDDDTIEERLDRVRWMIFHYEKDVDKEIESWRVDLRKDEWQMAEKSNDEVILIDSSDDESVMQSDSPEPKITWESEKACREWISVKPKYPQQGEKEEKEKKGTSIGDDDVEAFGDCRRDGQKVGIDRGKLLEAMSKANKRHSNQEVDWEVDAIVRQDDPVQILSAVVDDGDRPGCSTTTGASENGIRDMITAMQASMTDFFGNATQQQAAVGANVGQPPQQRAAPSPAGAQNFVQINVNVQQPTAFGIHLQQQRQGQAQPPLQEEAGEVKRQEDGNDYYGW